MHSFVIPEELHNANVLVEATHKGLKRRQSYYSQAFAVQVCAGADCARGVH